jgi:hypothetical protein
MSTTTETVPAPQLSPLQEIQLRAAVEPDFRARLLADPRAVLAEAGLEVPTAVEIAVEESTADRLVLALPPAVDADELSELSEDELGATQGGVLGLAIAGVLGLLYWLSTRPRTSTPNFSTTIWHSDVPANLGPLPASKF